MTVTMDKLWDDVSDALADAKGIAFDGCHKIYVLMDDFQVTDMGEIGYEVIELDSLEDDEDALDIVKRMYEMSCFLRFVNSITTIGGETTNESFDTLIPQGAEEEEE